ncbi:MAG: TetR/AcrR family transcriptional regulator [Planctomycetota bacterium]
MGASGRANRRNAAEMSERTERDQGGRERVLAAGRLLFFKHGFAAVSTDMIAKEAKLSKATLYKHFDNLADVLVAVIQVEADRIESGGPVFADTWPEFRVAMVRYGTNLLRFLNDPEIIRFTQLVHEEARLHPGVAQPFFSSALESTHRRITAMIEHADSCGYLDITCTPAETAEQLMGMWEPLRWSKALVGLSNRPYPRPGDWAEKCVHALLSPKASS